MVRSRSRGAFTLVELLVVIGVIGLLLSILLPALARARSAANDVVCQNNLKQWGVGLQQYVDQNKGYLPQKGPGGTNTTSDAFGVLSGAKVTAYDSTAGSSNDVVGYSDPSLWFNALPPLVNNKSYYQMLVDSYHHLDPLPYGGGPPSIYICPDMAPAGYLNPNPGFDKIDPANTTYFELGGYDANKVIMNSTGLVPQGWFDWDASYAWNSKMTAVINQTESETIKMTKLRPASDCAVMVEKIGIPQEYADLTVQAYMSQFAKGSDPFSGDIQSDGYHSNVAQPKADWRRFTTRHRHGGHLLFADGHVAWYSWTQAQIQMNEMPGNRYNANFSDANQPGNELIWCPLGPTN